MHYEVVVAGHVCLDIIPAFEHQSPLAPGTLVKVGPPTLATGGAVSNTGSALHRLGIKTKLMGKVGDDLFGRAVLDLLRPINAEGMVVAPGETTSYSVVINQPGRDRTFLHCTGANDTVTADDVDEAALSGVRLLHFGYPTLMRSIYQDGGAEMVAIFRKAKKLGLTTSLDMSLPDPSSEAGRVDWISWLKHVLPVVDIFLPSLDETRSMLGNQAPSALLRVLHEFGAQIVGLKMGSQGLRVLWQGCELSAPCFAVEVVGTIGSGDCTIAGFLAGFLRGLPPADVVDMACAVGACCCEAADATSGVRSWDETRGRMARGWERLSSTGKEYTR